ncbi:hypothetical protein [Propionibacterium acidifaciens]|uniref:hypothetical protein n=1 Tax=Propionibacterium acidifaciens TaxID=556499 RepID=UPI0028DB6CE7|nr:hypothetical protein [Propionibacterium acidifaciens]
MDLGTAGFEFKPNKKGIRQLALRAPGTEQVIADKTGMVYRALLPQLNSRQAKHASSNIAGIRRPRGYVTRWGGLRAETADGALDKALRSAAGR